MRKVVLCLAAAVVGVLPISSYAADTSAKAATKFSDAQRAEIEEIIKDYVTDKHPEILGTGLQVLQMREQQAAEAKTKEKLVMEKEKIFNDPATPVAGNVKGKVAIVEFYDYQCGYCKASEEAILRLLKEEKDVKFVFKNFPVLGPVSVEAAKAGMASVKQGKFQAFHTAMMTKKEHLSSETIYQIAKDVGLDVEKLKKDMADPSVTGGVEASMKLGQDIGVRGTPFFIVNDEVYPGVLQYEQLKKAVSVAMDKAK